jgi:hypothetical protein
LLFASNTAQQTVTFEANISNNVSISGETTTPVILNSAVAGENLATEIRTNITMSIETTEENKQLVAYLNKELPEGITLSVELRNTPGISQGIVPLSTNAIAVISNLSNTERSDIEVIYYLQAQANAGVVLEENYFVFFMIL